jgi:excisionase family DNA binding protein
MSHPIQFGARKNPAPHARLHGLRLAADESDKNRPADAEMNGTSQLPTHAAPHNAATAGEAPNPDRLLTVQEVANLLHVPVSWVYGRMRKRSLQQLPGYRLGKYWRFQREEVLAWVERQGRDFNAA